MADDFADMFTHKGSLREEDVIDISDDDEDEIVETFEPLDSKKRGKKQPTLSTPKKRKTKDSRDISSSDGNSFSINIDEEDFSLVNSNNNNNNKNSNNNNNSSNKNKQVYTLDDDDDYKEDEDEDYKPKVYTKTPVLNFLKQSSTLSSNNSSNSSNNKSNSFTPIKDTYTYTSTSTNSSPQIIKKKNDGIPLLIKLAGEQNERIVFYYDTEIQKLLDLYCGKKNLDPKTVQFKLYGLVLDPKKTPRELDLLDEDILEVSIKPIESIQIPSLDFEINANNTNTTTSSLSIPLDDDTPKVILKVNYEKQTHKFKIGMSDPFTKLIAALTKKIGDIPTGKKIVLKFDGMNLDPNTTPEDEDMEDDFIIDASLFNK